MTPVCVHPFIGLKIPTLVFIVPMTFVDECIINIGAAFIISNTVLISAKLM